MKLPGTDPASPLGRWIGRVGGGRLSPRGLRIVGLGAGLALALLLIAVLFMVQVSSTPQFCGTCHIMQPYYQSWKHSKHNQVACVDCHISPGLGAEVRKKYEAVSMVVKYITGTYGTNPWAEVDDAACLRCHERRLLEGKEVYHDVLFDHTPHLTETRRGLRLRCTSCHSQIVQGTHIAVTSSTCALCHFKGQALNQQTARCRLCHEIPQRVVTAGGVSFDHGEVGRLDMECSLCHANVVRGVGNVPRERCVTCHNDPSRLTHYGDKDLLHRMHVTSHKVDCMTCHLTIEHGRAPDHALAAAADSSAAPGPAHAEGQTGCETCHGAGHSAQQNLYAGLGGRGVPRMPSPMYAAGVRCEGCHNPALTAAAEAVPAGGAAGGSDIHIQRASEVSCMSCHGPAYRRIFEAWKQSVDERVAALGRQLDVTAPAMGASPSQAWLDARVNYSLVERGHGIHNVNFAYALLEKSHEQMNQARGERGLKRLDLPWKSLPASAGTCTTCHQGVERYVGTFAGHRFAHGPHLAEARLECVTCHRPHAERAPGEVVRFGPEGCLPCHHTASEVKGTECARCHGDITKLTVPSFRGEFSHRAHVDTGAECSLCHQPKNGDPRPDRAVCANCHAEK